jgi:UDP-N-acetylglucosamine 4-epimerase
MSNTINIGRKGVMWNYAATFLGNIPHSLACVANAKQLLNYQPLYSMKEGLKKAVEWY